MDIEAALLAEHSKPQAMRIRDYIGRNAGRFEELMQCFFSEEKRLCQRAAWVLSHCVERYPHLVVPHLEAMVAQLKKPIHVTVKRNTVRILQMIHIPEDLQGELVNICFDFLLDPKEAIAVQAFSMTVLYNITLEEPELKEELRVVIEEMMPHGSAGIKSRGGKILKALTKI